MMIIVTRHSAFRRPGTPLTFEVFPDLHPQILPHDVRDHILAIGAGYLAPQQPGNRNGGIAASIKRKSTPRSPR
jgi:hypothetical protein